MHPLQRHADRWHGRTFFVRLHRRDQGLDALNSHTATPTVAPRPQHRLHAVLTRERRSPNSKEPAMFKLIGSVVVYGFALLGLATYLENLHGE